MCRQTGALQQFALRTGLITAASKTIVNEITDMSATLVDATTESDLSAKIKKILTEMSDHVDETQGCARRITTDISAMCAMNVRYAKNVDSKNVKRVWCVCRATPIVTKTTYCEADGDVDTLRSTSTSTTTTTTFQRLHGKTQN